MKKRKRAITLLEIMIVIILIGLILAVVGVNVRGGLKKGKEFKSEQGAKKLESILELEMAEGRITRTDLTKLGQLSGEAREKHLKELLQDSPLVRKQDISQLLKDGWGEDYQISVDKAGRIEVRASQ